MTAPPCSQYDHALTLSLQDAFHAAGGAHVEGMICPYKAKGKTCHVCEEEAKKAKAKERGGMLEEMKKWWEYIFDNMIFYEMFKY